MSHKVKKTNRSYLVELFFLLIIGVFFSFYHLSQHYIFEYDQERDYYQVKTMVVEKKISLIGPRVISSAGFYLGPWYYFFQAPFFIAFSGNPLYGAYFTGFISVSICLLIYLVLRRYTSTRLIPLLAAILWVSGDNRINWNVAFVPLFFLLFLSQYWELEKKSLFPSFWFLTIIFSLSLNFHPQMIFLAPVWLSALFQFRKSNQKITPKQISLLLLAAFGPFLPLVIFDFRHNFVNLNAVLNFLSLSPLKDAATPIFRPLYSLRQFSTTLAFISTGFRHNLAVTSIILGASLTFCLKFKKYLFLFSITLFSLLVLSLYREATWPEYYHYLAGFSLFILIFIAASKIPAAKIVLLLTALFMIQANFNFLTTFIKPGSYYYKKSMILWMLMKNKPYQKLNIENDFKYGEGLGFLPIREFYESKTGEYNPNLKFYVSNSDSQKHNSTRTTFGMYAISLISTK